MGQKQDAKPWSDPSGRPSLGKFNLFRSYNEILFSPPEGRMTPWPFLPPPRTLTTMRPTSPCQAGEGAPHRPHTRIAAASDPLAPFILRSSRGWRYRRRPLRRREPRRSWVAPHRGRRLAGRPAVPASRGGEGAGVRG